MTFKHHYAQYTEALYQALSEDAFYQTMEASVMDQTRAKAVMLSYFDFSMQEAKKFGALYIPEQQHFGVSVWSKPLSKANAIQKNQEKTEFIRTEMGATSLDTYHSIVEFMAEKAESLIDGAAWYLSIVGILPQFQGQGLGADLIAPILNQTDSLNTPTYLETFTPRNIKFYEKLGYQVAASFYEPTTQSDYSVLIREPYGS